jgi:hypothetical protein
MNLIDNVVAEVKKMIVCHDTVRVKDLCEALYWLKLIEKAQVQGITIQPLSYDPIATCNYIQYDL